MGLALARASATREVNFGNALLDNLGRLIEKFERFAAKAEALGELPSAIVATREIRETLELAHRMTVELRRSEPDEITVTITTMGGGPVPDSKGVSGGSSTVSRPLLGVPAKLPE
jgi:hypothetical protein